MATIDVYTAVDTYVVYKEDTAWGTAGTPTGTDYVDRVSGVTCTVKNNRQRFNSLGSVNANIATNGAVEISGSISAQLTNPDFFQYLVNGVKVANAATEADPSDINEVDNVGYSATTCPSITLEFGTDGGTVDDRIKIDGVIFTNWRLSAKVGEAVVWSADFRGRNINRSASGALVYTGPTEEPFTFADGNLTVGSDTVVRVDSFELTGANNTAFYYALGSRLLQQPTMGTRRYDFTITIVHSDDTTSNKLSGTEIRELLFGAASSTTPETGGTPTEFGDIKLTLTEGAATGDETIIFQLEGCYLEEISEPIEMSDTGGPIMFSISGFALAALTNSTNNTLVEYYTHT